MITIQNIITKDDLRVAFCEGEQPTHDWADLEPLVDCVYEQDKDKVYGNADWNISTYRNIAKDIAKYKLLYTDGRYGWITDKGKFLTCDYHGHEILLECLGYDIQNIEDTWIRVSRTLMAMESPNDAQAATLMRLLDEEKIHKPMVDKYLARGFAI